jgi:hypothetical protein
VSVVSETSSFIGWVIPHLLWEVVASSRLQAGRPNRTR